MGKTVAAVQYAFARLN